MVGVCKRLGKYRDIHIKMYVCDQGRVVCVWYVIVCVYVCVCLPFNLSVCVRLCVCVSWMLEDNHISRAVIV